MFSQITKKYRIRNRKKNFLDDSLKKVSKFVEVQAMIV